MSLTLSVAKARVSVHLNDTGQLIWSETMLETALREALQAVGRVLGEPLTLDGLDGAGETILPEDVEHILVIGAVTYALTFRASGRFEDARAAENLPEALGNWAGTHMARFQAMLAQVKRQGHQTAGQPPYAGWEWEEKT
ncbi:MAG: hypothetical protein H0S79_10720 [Anaerolineaceae bacterium]|nr:hypothetical protein [Anaerolineaceae bacterium]